MPGPGGAGSAVPWVTPQMLQVPPPKTWGVLSVVWPGGGDFLSKSKQLLRTTVSHKGDLVQLPLTYLPYSLIFLSLWRESFVLCVCEFHLSILGCNFFKERHSTFFLICRRSKIAVQAGRSLTSLRGPGVSPGHRCVWGLTQEPEQTPVIESHPPRPLPSSQ